MNNLNISDISNLNCPQYVNFETLVLKQNGLASSPSSLSLKDYDENSMVVDDQSSVTCTAPDESSISRNLYSPCSDISNCQTSPGGYSLRSASSKRNYPVIHLNDVKLPGSKNKKLSKNGKAAKVKTSNISATPKRKREDEHIPLAQQVENFYKKTPERFHNHGPKEFQPNRHWSPPKLTRPVSPNLQAAKRARGTHYLSQEEKEALEAEEMKRYRFRARPVCDGILQRRQSLKVQKKAPTKPQDVQLRTAQRAAESASTSKTEEKPYEFRARPVPAAIFNGPTGIKEIPAPTLTEAKTPNFRLKKRAELWKSHNHLEETVEVFKAQPVPVFNAPLEVKCEKKVTEIQPFSFDEKDKERMLQKEKKIKEIEKGEVFQFKAQPMPSATPSKLPAVPKKPTTQVEPFHFLSEELISRHSSFDSTTDKIGASFKAQPATVLKKPPFVPEKPNKNTIEIKEFQLHTDIRASERLKLKEINAIKEQEKEQALLRLKQLQEEQEKKEIARIRREAVHRANPIRVFKPLEIKPSSKPPTEPISPKFRTEERLQKKQSLD